VQQYRAPIVNQIFGLGIMHWTILSSSHCPPGRAVVRQDMKLLLSAP
jgi:hypothetical protein